MKTFGNNDLDLVLDSDSDSDSSSSCHIILYPENKKPKTVGIDKNKKRKRGFEKINIDKRMKKKQKTILKESEILEKNIESGKNKAKSQGKTQAKTQSKGSKQKG